MQAAESCLVVKTIQVIMCLGCIAPLLLQEFLGYRIRLHLSYWEKHRNTAFGHVFTLPCLRYVFCL